MSRRATVVGTGLIGGSVGLALRRRGWHVSAVDVDAEVAAEAVRIGAADEIGLDPASELVVIAAPVGAVAELAIEALEKTSAVVTDVGSTKNSICQAVDNPRFVGGHPMAGSEQDGLAGAVGDLFDGAMWVLTPLETTDESAFATVRAVVRSFGTETLALPPDVHDELVAHVSHVPHLTAAALMNLADVASIEHRALLRLAAGGFRDMTRISAGRPSIWPDICVANGPAIVEGLDDLIGALNSVRRLVVEQDRAGIMDLLTAARSARINLPVGFGPADDLVELAVPIPDRPGEIAAIATLAAELDVNIFDLEISHSGEGRQGIMLIVVDEARSERFMGGLMARSYRPTVRTID
ncbi:MAG: prephenate dehydrogenase/arogenate dehydrogenase family protein [Actinomycetia bacterium]|nr:prephenate dehydrogenase/arogenate dehydrogenase family protein [Actinomycetes bacterium]MCP5034544.1 prephenate dehydrogenase/arogenate dehydrogenase family protein [Actinomycetes bacterium]